MILMGDEHTYVNDDTVIGWFQWKDKKHEVGLEEKGFAEDYSFQQLDIYVSLPTSQSILRAYRNDWKSQTRNCLSAA